eukprot:8825470-Ditylum_brightwellii.AAC.1
MQQFEQWPDDLQQCGSLSLRAKSSVIAASDELLWEFLMLGFAIMCISTNVMLAGIGPEYDIGFFVHNVGDRYSILGVINEVKPEPEVFMHLRWYCSGFTFSLLEEQLDLTEKVVIVKYNVSNMVHSTH